MTKPIAFFIHFVISLAVVLLVYLVIRYQLYPGFYFSIQGVSEIILLLFVVDVILGPLLTFIVYKPGKKSLKFDLSVIALCQIAALAYGTYVIYKERPLSALLISKAFAVQTASNYDLNATAEGTVDTSLLSSPKFHVFEADAKLSVELVHNYMTGKGDMEVFLDTNYYKLLKDQNKRVEGAALSIEELAAISPSLETDTDTYFYVRIIGKAGQALALIEKEGLKVADVLVVSDLKQ